MSFFRTPLTSALKSLPQKIISPHQGLLMADGHSSRTTGSGQKQPFDQRFLPGKNGKFFNTES